MYDGRVVLNRGGSVRENENKEAGLKKQSWKLQGSALSKPWFSNIESPSSFLFSRTGVTEGNSILLEERFTERRKTEAFKRRSLFVSRSCKEAEGEGMKGEGEEGEEGEEERRERVLREGKRAFPSLASLPIPLLPSAKMFAFRGL